MSTAERPWAGVVHGLGGRAGDSRTIKARQPSPSARAREAWQYRQLIPFFGRRFVAKLYANTYLGKAWIPLRPLMSVVPSILLFGGFLKVPSEGVPYAVYFLAGMSAWRYFELLILWCTRCLELSRKHLKRIYFPRLILISASVYPALIMYLMYVLIWLAAVGYFVVVDDKLYLNIDPTLVKAPAGMALATAMAFAFGFWTSIFGAQSRDMRFTLGYILRFWLYITPVIFPYSSVPDGLKPLALYNPMTAPIELVKQGLLGVGTVPATSLFITLGTILVVGTSGVWFFTRSEAAALDSL